MIPLRPAAGNRACPLPCQKERGLEGGLWASACAASKTCPDREGVYRGVTGRYVFISHSPLVTAACCQGERAPCCPPWPINWLLRSVPSNVKRERGTGEF